MAAYARVSTDHEDQESSLTAQTDYYRKKILQHAGWQFAGVFVDDGISGLSTNRREGFNRMIDSCLNGDIDLVLTKSISRFARNTVDTVNIIRKLKEKGIGVYFEKENIFTLDSKGEFLLTIMSSLAQEESRSISENFKWGQRKRFADGNYSLPWKSFYGYDKGEDGKPVINENQAEFIRLIYKMFLEGYSAQAIVNELYTRGIKSPMGKDKWNGYNIMYILQNEKMCGDALLQKKYTESFLTKKQIKNNGEVPQYLVEDDHEGIIDRRAWELVQAEISRRKSKKYSGTSIFSSKIICGECGNYYGSKVWHSTDKYRRVIWRCNHKYDGKTCNTPHLTEDEIKELFIKALGELLSDKDEVIENLTLLREAVSDTSELEKQLTDAETEMNLLAEMVQEAVSENAHKAQDQKAYAEKYNSLVSRYDDQKKLHDELSDRITAVRGNDKQMEEFIRQLQELDGAVTEFDESLWSSLVDHITVMKDKKVIFSFKGGTEIEV